MVYDYIIAGSGPAGSTAAYCLQKKGAKCLILEAKSKKEEKICGGYITWSGIELLRQIKMNPDELLQKGAQQLNTLILERDHTVQTHRYHCGEYAIGSKRLLLDQWLLNHAIEAGAHIQFDCRFKNYAAENHTVKVGNYIGKNLVIATGARGYMNPSSRNLLFDQSFGISAHIRGNSALLQDCIYFWYLDQQSNDYFWAIPIEKNIWNIGIWFQSLPSHPLEKFYEMKKQWVDLQFDAIHYLIKPRGAFCGNVDQTPGLPENCFGLGDFAGNNRKNSGEGIRYAIESAIRFADSQ